MEHIQLKLTKIATCFALPPFWKCAPSAGLYQIAIAAGILGIYHKPAPAAHRGKTSTINGYMQFDYV